MPFLYTCFAVLASLVAYQLYAILNTRRRKLELERQNGCQALPKFPNPLFTNTFDTEVNQSYRNGHVNRTTLQHYQKVGSLTFEVHTRTIGYQICTADPVNHQAITSKINDFIRPQYGSGPFFGDHLAIIYQAGKDWKRTRDLAAPLFKQAESKDIQQFGKFIDRFIPLIPDNQKIDIQPLMRKLFFDSATESIFGKSLDGLRDATSKSDEFIEAYNRALIGAGRQERPHTLSYMEWIGFTDKAWLADCKVVHDFIDECIAHHRNPSPSSTDKPSSPGSQQPYTLIAGMSPVIPDPVTLRFHLLGVFAMAHETSAMAAANVLFMLARHPHLWTELRHLSLTLPPHPNPLTYDHLQNLSLFRNTVFETLRLHSPITRITRDAKSDLILPRGGGPSGQSPILVPRGTPLRLDWFPKFQNPEIWGADVDDFRPSRWDNRRLTPDFLPFSSGPRMCPANQLVITQLVHLLVRLTQEFERIENRDACYEFVEGVMVCYESRNGCVIALHRAAGEGGS